jgi:metal-dependent amidase/aminoacylase/carboxypeptidase family protein
MPLQQHKGMAEIFRANAVDLVGEDNVGYVNHRGGSTDMGDISHLMPVIHPYIGGAVGLSHGATYVIEDYSLAVIKGAKALAYMVIDMLGDNASQGNSIVGGQRPDMTIPEYLKFMRNLASEETFKGA